MWIVSNDGSYVYGYASAEDTGGFIYWSGSSSTVCDLYFDSEGQASAFGRRGVTIYIL
jgi:3D (Asp-Asp-Asp) domain-containing protein